MRTRVSKYHGVVRVKDTQGQNWEVRTWVKGKSFSAGRYPTEEEAAHAWDNLIYNLSKVGHESPLSINLPEKMPTGGWPPFPKSVKAIAKIRDHLFSKRVKNIPDTSSKSELGHLLNEVGRQLTESERQLAARKETYIRLEAAYEKL